MFHDLFNALEETLFMVFTAGLLTWLLGLPLGTLLAVTRSGQVMQNRFLNTALNTLVRISNGIPYLVFMVALIPITRFLMGTQEGIFATLLPLTCAAIPFFARLVDQSIHKVPIGLVEASKAYGASNWQIVYKVLIPEALPNIIMGLTTTLIHLVGYSVIAGALGGGGLGGLILQKGYQIFQVDYVLGTLILLLLLIQLIEACGGYIVHGSFNRQ